MTEAELEEMIMENLDKLEERGFPKMYAETSRQYRLKCGIVDILSSELYGDDKLKIKIIEIKKDAIDMDTVKQSLKYFNEVCSLFDRKDTSDYEVILIGASFCKKNLPILEYLPFISVYTYRYGVDGLWFEKQDISMPCKIVDEKSDLALMQPCAMLCIMCNKPVDASGKFCSEECYHENERMVSAWQEKDMV